MQSQFLNSNIMSTLTRLPSENEIIHSGKDPPDLQGEFVRFRFPDEECFKKDFIDRCIRLPFLMYDLKVKDRKPKKLKGFVREEYSKNNSVQGYVHHTSKFIRSTRERRHKWYDNTKCKEVEGYQYYTVEFNFSSGLHQVTTDVLLFIKVNEYGQQFSTYWTFYPNHVDLEILHDK